MSVQLLDMTRSINQLLHNHTPAKHVVNEICLVLAERMQAHTLIFDTDGQILGYGSCSDVPQIEDPAGCCENGHIDSVLNARFLNVLSSQENVSLGALGLENPTYRDYAAFVCPVAVGGNRLGTLFLYRNQERFGIDDIIVIEYASTVAGLELMRLSNGSKQAEDHKLQIVHSAIRSLTWSEKEAVYNILEELEGSEGILVASKIAARVGITSSVIVNALHKLESAGVIESRSSGKKGTYIKILNEYLFEELKAIRNRKIVEVQ